MKGYDTTSAVLRTLVAKMFSFYADLEFFSYEILV